MTTPVPICWANLLELQGLPDVGEAPGLNPTQWVTALTRVFTEVRRGKRDDQCVGAW